MYTMSSGLKVEGRTGTVPQVQEWIFRVSSRPRFMLKVGSQVPVDSMV